MHFCAWTDTVHIVLVKLESSRMTESIEYVCPESATIVRIFLVSDILHEDRRVKVDY